MDPETQSAYTSICNWADCPKKQNWHSFHFTILQI